MANQTLRVNETKRAVRLLPCSQLDQSTWPTIVAVCPALLASHIYTFQTFFQTSVLHFFESGQSETNQFFPITFSLQRKLETFGGQTLSLYKYLKPFNPIKILRKHALLRIDKTVKIPVTKATDLHRHTGDWCTCDM